jgi:hypothetical protein
MKSHASGVFILIGFIGLSALAEAQEQRQSQSDDARTVDQLREEKFERDLADVIQRCQKMHDIQSAVCSDTKALDKIIQGNADQKPSAEDRQAAKKLADKMVETVTVATEIIDMLGAAGSAIAFPEAFQEIREDMKRVRRRLELGDAGIATQNLELDIIDTLTEMLKALKKG